MSTIAERVRDLVETSGLSQHAFAQRTGMDESKLSKSLSGARRFSSLDLARIAEEYAVTVDWLVTGADPPLALAARSTSGGAVTALEAAKRYSTIRSDMAMLGYPQSWHPVAAAPANGRYQDQGTALADRAVARVQEMGRSIADADLAALVEGVFGVDVAVVDLVAGFDGLATASDQARLILLAASPVPARTRFTLAHELGHLLGGDDQGMHLDEDVFDKTQAKEPSEMRANAFASAFLMPETMLSAAVGPSGLGREAFAELACELMISPSALAYRLLRLRLVDAGTCEQYKTMSAAGVAQLADRGDALAARSIEANRPRPPGLLVRDAYHAYQAGAATLRPYANLLDVDVEQVRRALGSPDGRGDGGR